MSELLVDKDGTAFTDYPAMLPKRCAHWPPANIVRSGDVLRQYRHSFPTCCQMCGRDSGIAHVHHIIGGAGRSDELTNLLVLCLDCHDESWSVILPECEYAKWLTDRDNLSWCRLAVLLGHHLPEPKPKGASDGNAK